MELGLVEEPELLPSSLSTSAAIVFKTREQEMADCWLQTKKIMRREENNACWCPSAGLTLLRRGFT